jgi:hypothetical protein
LFSPVKRGAVVTDVSAGSNWFESPKALFESKTVASEAPTRS